MKLKELITEYDIVTLVIVLVIGNVVKFAKYVYVVNRDEVNQTFFFCRKHCR